MKKHMMRRLISGLCAAAVILSSALIPGPGSSSRTAYGAVSVPKDVTNHWAKSYITTAIEKKIVSGYDDGTFRPNVPVSRAEFSHMLNAALSNKATASIQFSDVKSSSWYYADVQKAVAAGYASGYDNGTFKPTASINRQEAAVMLTRVVPTYNTATSLTKFKDASTVSSWAKDAMARAVGRGYISGTGSGSNVRLDPQGKLTRAQAVVIICKLLEKETIVTSTYSVTGSSTLKDTIYSNGITIPSSFKNDVVLNNCVVLGTLNAYGTGNTTLTNCRVANASVSGSGAELTAKGETSVKTTTVSSGASLNTSISAGSSMYAAGFESVTIARNAEANLNGTFPAVSLDGSGASVTLNGAKVTALTVTSNASNATVTVDTSSTVSKATVNGANTSFKGSGTVSVMAANANGITFEKQPSTLTTGNGVTTRPVLVNASLTITADPKNGATNVAVDKKIYLSFSSAVKTYKGDTISSSDVDDLLELRKGSASGSTISFDASINSTKTQITITPRNDLAEDTRYYITMAKNRVKTSKGEANDAFSSYFTTESNGRDSDGDLTFDPKNGAKNVDLDETLTITFPQKVINYDGSSISSRDLQDIVILRETNSRGSDVDFTATINSGKTKITITPDEDLEPDTKYYLAIESRSLKTSSGKETVAAESVTWTTTDEGGDTVTFSPKNKATGVKSSADLTITFDSAIIRYSGSSSVTSSYIEDYVELREGSSSGTKVPFSGSINSSKTKITIDPDSSLKAGTRYYLSFGSKAFRWKSDDSRIPAESIYFTVTGSAVEPTVDQIKSTETTISADFYGSVKGTVYAVLLPYGDSKPTATQVKNGQNAKGVTVTDGCKASTGSLAANTAKKLTFTDLDPDTSYTLYVVLDPSSGSISSVVSKNVSTTKPSIPTALLSNIQLSTGTLNFSPTKMDYDVILPNGTKEVTVTAKADGYLYFDKDNSPEKDSNAKTVDVSSGTGSVSITVFDAGKEESTYEIRFTVKEDTGLETLTVNGHSIKSSMKYTLTEEDGTTASIRIVTSDPEADIKVGISEKHEYTTDVTVDYGQTETFEFTVISNGVKEEYTITLEKPNKDPEAGANGNEPAPEAI